MLLRNNLDGKKFLLVLDDLWNEDRGKWIELRNLLMGGANGSKILVTTRSPTIASMMGTMSPYNLEGLLHQECLYLFIKWAFDEGKERQHTNLVEIGDAIVKKCKGVPLAVKSLGSLLYSKLDERDWLFVRDNEMWKLNRKEGDILSILQLSYNQMPSYLKQCFAFLSLFPKDYEFNTFDLIPFWMANGFLQSPNENQEPEDIGNQYIDELYSKCFLEDYIDIGHV
ncbi:putative disease resistance protein RGA4 [Quercus lobata]|nr:putative disease resistance protein RGA4 [Quercus lobata]